MKSLALAPLLLCCAIQAQADCVVNATSKTTYEVLDSHTILLKGGAGGAIMVKSFSFFYSSSSVRVLQDSFCDFASAVLYVDGEPIDVQQVKQL
jgi:hypothetical protein